MFLVERLKVILGGGTRTQLGCQSHDTKMLFASPFGSFSYSSIPKLVYLSPLLTFPADFWYSVKEPLEKVNPDHGFDIWEGLLYTMVLAFSLEGMRITFTPISR
jgi:hypothetical protein